MGLRLTMRPVVKDGLNVLTVCHGLQFGARAYVASAREVFLKGKAQYG
jgi:hypothetical protein